jgi:hypothetical protein
MRDGEYDPTLKKRVWKPKKNKAHSATGKPKGGHRPGSGRPPGSKNLLPQNATKAIKSLNMRVPADASEGQKELLQESEDAIVRVMRGKAHSSVANPMLKAAITVREEIVGPIAKQVNVKAEVGLTDMLDEVARIEAEEKKEQVVAKAPIIRKSVAGVVVSEAVAEALTEKDEE